MAMLGFLFVMFLILGCFTYCWNSLMGGASRKLKQTRNQFQSTRKTIFKPRVSNDALGAAYANLEVAGYVDATERPLGTLTYVDDDIIAEMLVEAHREGDLRRTLPGYGLRLRNVPEDAPEAFKAKYNFIVASPTHAIGVLL